MKMVQTDVTIIGSGAAGLGAAIAAKKPGAGKVLVLERGERLGGILHQCIHNGFGLHKYNEDLTGPEYIARVISELGELDITCRLRAMVIDLTARKEVFYVHPEDGIVKVDSKSIVLAMGCRERTRHGILIPGDRPAGIFSAGTAQRLLNLDGLKPGREVVVVGSGDIGLIMARRCCLEGMAVQAVVEMNPYPGGLIRNVVQCLDDFDIPLLLSTKVMQIVGRNRVEKVIVAKIDEGGEFIDGTEQGISCDTVLISAGLIPENELSGVVEPDHVREILLLKSLRSITAAVSREKDSASPHLMAQSLLSYVGDIGTQVAA